LASFVTSEDFLKLGFANVQGQLIKAENGDITEVVPLEKIDRYFTKTHNNLPEPDYNRTGFIGRSNELKKLREAIRSRRNHTIAITGPGGTGKTAFTLRLLNDIANEGEFDFIFFYTAKSEHLTADGITRSGQRKTLDDLKEAVDFWKIENQIGEGAELRSVCLCFDNIETVIEDSFDDIFTFIYSLPDEWKVIFTSRINVPDCHTISLKSLDPASSKRLAIEYSKVVGGNDLLNLLAPKMDSFLEDMAGNPLSIKVAINLINSTSDINESVEKTREMIAKFSFENLMDFLPEEAILILEYMRQVGWVSSDDIEIALGLSKQDISQALRTVQDTSLVDRKFDEERDLHLYTTSELSRSFLISGGVSEDIRSKVSKSRRMQNDESRITSVNYRIFSSQEHDLAAPENLPPRLLETLIKAGPILRDYSKKPNRRNAIRSAVSVGSIISEWKSNAPTPFKSDYYYSLVLGVLLGAIEDKGAEEALEAAVKSGVNLDRLRSEFVLARFYMNENRLDDAREIYESILEIYPGMLRAVQGLALSLQFTNHHENLVASVEKLVQFEANHGGKDRINSLIAGSIRRLAQLPNPLSQEHLNIGIDAAIELEETQVNPSSDFRVGNDVEVFLDNLLSWRSHQRIEQFSNVQAISLAKLVASVYNRKSSLGYFEGAIGCSTAQEVVNWLVENFEEFSSDLFELSEPEANVSKHFSFEASSPEIEVRISNQELVVVRILRMPIQKRFFFAQDINSTEQFFVPFATNFGDRWHTDILDIGSKLALKAVDQGGELRTAVEWYFLANK
jgi:tetratricopeptide (TPR) repeat protein